MTETTTQEAPSGTVGAVVVPDGFRLLVRGDRIRKGDIYCRGPGHSWHETRGFGTWTPEGFWPMARRHNTPVERPAGSARTGGSKRKD